VPVDLHSSNRSYCNPALDRLVFVKGLAGEDSVTVTTLSDLLDHSDPHDPFALHKASLAFILVPHLCTPLGARHRAAQHPHCSSGDSQNESAVLTIAGPTLGQVLDRLCGGRGLKVTTY
jgi:hypothetical protein